MTESEERALITEGFPKFRGMSFKRYEGCWDKYFPKLLSTHRVDKTTFHDKNATVWRYNPIDKGGNFVYVMYVFEKNSQVVYEEINIHV